MDEKVYKLTEQLRKELHEMVDRQLNDLQTCLENGVPKVVAEIELPLSAMPAYFKSKKPVGIVYPNGTMLYTSTWKQVALNLLKECNSDDRMYGKLKEISGKVFGRNRLLLGQSGEGMDSPLKIAEGIYFESKFDTESLLKVLAGRIFDAIGYDYSRIHLKVINPSIREDQKEALAEEDASEDEGFSPTL